MMVRASKRPQAGAVCRDESFVTESDSNPFRPSRRETAIARALLQEAYLTQSPLNGGMTAVRRIWFQDQGAFEGFFGLANGIERMAKLILFSDNYARTGTFPTTKELRGLGHDLVDLVELVEMVARARCVDCTQAPCVDGRSHAAVGFLSRFALTNRYSNLNRLSQGDSPSIDDPLSRWVALVGQLAPKPQARSNAERHHRAFARYLDANVAVQIDFTGADGNPIRNLESATAHGYEDEWIGVQGMLLAVRPLALSRAHDRSPEQRARAAPVLR
jgi:hypothetical protein